MILPKVNPALLHRFHRDHTASELEMVHRLLGFVPDSDPGAHKALWEKFQRDQATVFERRDEAGQIVSICFFEIRDVCGHGSDFCILATHNSVAAKSFREADLREIEKHARQLGCVSMSFATMRPGLALSAIEQGWFLSEFVCRKDLRA